MEVALSIDHFGRLGVEYCIGLGRALEKYNPSWLENLILWQEENLCNRVTDALAVPTAASRFIQGIGRFDELCRAPFVDVLNPDPLDAGGILETKLIGDTAQRNDIGMAIPAPATPISFMAAVHCAAATEDLLVLDCRVGNPSGWDMMVGGLEKPIIKQGYVTVPEEAGLGIT